MSSITIANLFLGLTIVCLALSAQLAMPLSFVLSWLAVILAGAMRHDELVKAGRLR